mmetsp:Transcript_15983/g.48853  ORF Transcript_15983/g.48853 Transcript_15983/m.48853 type:complete len:1056 (-) Transcript_15983:31-3198(-)
MRTTTVALARTARFSTLVVVPGATAKGGKANGKRSREPKEETKEKGDAPASFARRDAMLSIQADVQALWEAERPFETDRHADTGNGKFIVTFPYPYMNGRLHLGHAFSMTKAEFRAHYERLKGKNVLFPFGFHCTGMPIQAAANKLRDELATYGCPPQFPAEELAANEAAKKAAEEKKKAAEAPEKKGKGKKTKLVAKTGTGIVRTWNILKRMVPEDEIPEFVDPIKWLRYFPPRGMDDLKGFGAGCDWRRSFITTQVNPYYDSFIRWQFAKLRSGGRIKFGTRPSVFSIRDQQVCADHDRASGEGAVPQEYTIIKLRVPESALSGHAKLGSLSGKNVFLAPATLRPETMYGQTNCFVLPDGEYGAYEVLGGDVLVMSERAARGMMYQELAPGAAGEVKCLVPGIKGWDLLGLPLNCPQATYETVYTLPLLSISMGKGTGVVTSVPSDAPDDYAALRQLQDKPDYAARYGVEPHMVDFAVVPIIEIPGYGSTAAVQVCERLGVRGPNDRDKLAAAKDEVYLKGFTDGVMVVGPYAGTPVKDAKPKIRAEMIAAGTALAYWEPDAKVMSRTGDECIVALTEQWYLSYDDAEWTQQVLSHVQSGGFNGYDDNVQGEFEHRIGWLGEWACSRKFGLGTLLPWDENWVIESLSDSTIYMAYYTVAHLLQGAGNMEGASTGPAGVPPEAFTEAVWDYIFLGGAGSAAPDCDVPADVLADLKGEFEYWYPMNLRVSAKDLIPNHLTMALFNHCEIWKNRPEMWPQGMYANGHILVDAEKMSKSKGNFIMMNEGVADYSADAVRFACADAGDTWEDANFARATANAAILSLTTELDFINETVAAIRGGAPALRNTELPAWTFFDRCFANDMNKCVALCDENCANMKFRDALKAGFFEMQLARDRYRDWASQTGAGMHAGLITRWIEAQVIMLAPFCPHWAEHVWRNVLAKGESVLKASWPAAEPEDALVSQMQAFLADAVKDFRRSTAKKAKGGKKGKGAAPAKKQTAAAVYVANEWLPWKQQVLGWMRAYYADNGDSFPKTFIKELKDYLMDEETLTLTLT